MPEWLKLLLSAGVGGLIAINRVNVFYRRDLVREAIKLRIAELKVKRARLEAEESEILTKRIERDS